MTPARTALPRARGNAGPGKRAAWKRTPLHDTGASPAGRLRAMTALLASATSVDVGLIVTFIGIGVLVNIFVVLIAIQIRGERQQNQAYLTKPDRTRRV
ncbi:MAG TPA: hypothetical protein VGH60_07070 [Solirubrobacteraceae bacterium]